MREPKVNYRETLVAYLKSDSLLEAANNLNISKEALYARLKTMKKSRRQSP